MVGRIGLEVVWMGLPARLPRAAVQQSNIIAIRPKLYSASAAAALTPSPQHGHAPNHPKPVHYH